MLQFWMYFVSVLQFKNSCFCVTI